MAGSNAPTLTTFTVEPPQGLSFAKHLLRGGRAVAGVSIGAAKLASAELQGGRLVMTVRRAVSSLSASLRAPVLIESAGLKALAKQHRLRSERLAVVIKDSARKSTTVSVQIRNLHP